jgi:hypothetical protein
MKMFSKPAVLAAALMLGSTTAAPSWSQSGAADLTDIAWNVSGAATGTPTLRISHESTSSSFPLDGGERDLGSVRAALGSPNQGSVTFTIDREAGLLTCRGTLERPYQGSGDCVFAPDAAFEAGVKARGLTPKNNEDLLTMALVDADLALIDGLTRHGLSPRSINDVIAAAALDVTPGYVAGLQSAGLALESIDDAVACRALDIDEVYVRGIVAAGYDPSARELIAMKATGVTPEYAQKINAAARH